VSPMMGVEVEGVLWGEEMKMEEEEVQQRDSL